MNKVNARKRRASRVRLKLRNALLDERRPVLTINRTNQHIYAQVIVYGESSATTIAAASTTGKSFDKSGKTKSELAKIVGLEVAKKAIEKGVKEVSFDRSGFKYHGVVKALADSAREAGLNF